MNWETVKGDWTNFKGKVKEQWGRLTDDELNQIACAPVRVFFSVAITRSYPVTAPMEADDTSLAYFASTPVL